MKAKPHVTFIWDPGQAATANGQVAQALCTCTIRNNFAHEQVAVVCGKGYKLIPFITLFINCSMYYQYMTITKTMHALQVTNLLDKNQQR